MENLYKPFKKIKRQFDNSSFIDDNGYLLMAYDAEKYHPEVAKKLSAIELDCDPTDIILSRKYCYFGIGYYDGEKRNGYWVSDYACGNSFPVIVCEVRR